MDLYQAIINRHSVRRFRNIPLSQSTLANVDEIISQTTPLIPKNRFVVMRRDVLGGEDLIAAMGGYGRILKPPHFLMSYIVGDQYPLVDLGYRMEQIAIKMVQLGVSICFVGSLGRESDIRIRFRLLRDARTAAFLIFGYPADTMTGRTVNAILRKKQGPNTKLTSDRIFYNETFEQPQSPPDYLAQLIEAGRLAPSANNAQPWRFLWYDQHLYLYVRKDNPRYGNKLPHQQYRFFDAGTCMGNITLAMKALGITGDWTLLFEEEPFLPQKTKALHPLAKLKLT
jgi:nitroreductase